MYVLNLFQVRLNNDRLLPIIHMALSSKGLGSWPLKSEMVSSNLPRVTKKFLLFLTKKIIVLTTEGRGLVRAQRVDHSEVLRFRISRETHLK